MSRSNFADISSRIESICANPPSEAFLGDSARLQTASFINHLQLGTLALTARDSRLTDATHSGLEVIGGLILQTPRVFRGNSVDEYLATLADDRTSENIMETIGSGVGKLPAQIEAEYGLRPDWYKLDQPEKDILHIEHGTGSFFSLQPDDIEKTRASRTGKNCPYTKFMGATVLNVALALEKQYVLDKLINPDHQ